MNGETYTEAMDRIRGEMIVLASRVKEKHRTDAVGAVNDYCDAAQEHVRDMNTRALVKAWESTL